MAKERHDCGVHGNRHLKTIVGDGKILKVWYKHMRKLQAFLRNQDPEAFKGHELHANRTSKLTASDPHTCYDFNCFKTEKGSGTEGKGVRLQMSHNYLHGIYQCVPRFP